MLNELHIENIAVIERADIAFGAGLNILTGETGAGKSILVDSLHAVLGAFRGSWCAAVRKKPSSAPRSTRSPPHSGAWKMRLNATTS